MAKVENNQHCSSNLNKKGDFNPNKISVFLGGFPYYTSTEDAEKYILSITTNIDYSIITRCKNLFRGFVFLHFEDCDDALFFTKKEY